MKKRILSLTLTLGLIFTLPHALAASEDFVIKDGVLTEYNGPGGNVTVPGGVTAIGDSAFERRFSLASIVIPPGVTSIGERAFSSCSGLVSVIIPESVTSIGSSAFYSCYMLKSITLHDSITEIGDRAFESSGLINVTVPKGITEISDYLFSGCVALVNATVSDSITRIGSYAFGGCVLLEKVIIPDSVTEIGVAAFSNCWYLKDIDIPGSVTRIGEGAFSGCDSLTSVTIPDSVTHIGEGAFSGSDNLTSITIPTSVVYIGERVFHHYGVRYGETAVWSYYPAVNLTIYGAANSYTELYAKRNGLKFAASGEDFPITAPGIDSASDWAKVGIAVAYARGFLPSELQGGFTAPITRGEFARLAMSWINYRMDMTDDELLSLWGLTRGNFTDTSDPVLLAAAALEITGGVGDGTNFGVNETFTRQQAAVMTAAVCRVIRRDTATPPDFGYPDIVKAEPESRDAINFVADRGVMTTIDGTNFGPDQIFSRQEGILVFNAI
jgi:hypothetical protein